MKRAIIIVFGALAALALGVLIVPSGLEQAFMTLRDGQFSEATQTFAERWQKGDRSREVANALSELYVRQGDPEKAAGILVTYIAKNPTDKEALSRLAEIFRDDQQRDKYIRTLETLWKQTGDINVLRNLESLYELAGQETQRLNALELLVRSKSAELADFEELASMLATRDPPKALTTLITAFKRWPGKIPPATGQTFVALAADLQKPDAIKENILPWSKAQAAYAAVEPVVVSLISKREHTLALETMLISGSLAKGEPASIVLTARLETKAQKIQSAFQRLEQLRAMGQLPPKAADAYIETGLLTKNRDLALAHLLEQGTESLPYWLVTWIVSKASETNDKEMLNTLASKFSSAKTPSQCFLMARVQNALGNASAAFKFAERVENSAADASAGIAVAGLFADLGNTPRAIAALNKYAPSAESVPLDDLAQATLVAILTKQAQQAFKFATLLRETRPDQSTDILYARALGLNGKPDEALSILEDIETWPEAKEAAVFEILRNAGRTAQLQKVLFERLVDDSANTAQRTNYAFMLNDIIARPQIASQDVVERIADDLDGDDVTGPARWSRIELLGKFSAAHAEPYAKESAEHNPQECAHIYLAILKRLNRKSEAITFISTAIDDLDDVKLRQNFLHEWIALGVTKPALPYLKDLAESRDRQWFFAYDEALIKLGEKTERLRFLSWYARRAGLDPAFKSQLASELLEAGGKQEAIALFTEDAKDAPARSKEVEQLLFIWGPRPPQEGIAWMSNRARNASGAEKVAWLERLLESGAAAEVITLGSEFYADGNRTVAPVLAAAMAQSKSKAQLEKLLNAELSQPPLPPAIAPKLAAAAEEAGLLRSAASLYQTASKTDKKWLPNAMRASWYAGLRAQARDLLPQLDLTKPADIEVVFVAAEIERDAQQPANARVHYETALRLASTSRHPLAKRIELMSLVHLGKLAEADALIQKPAYADLQADYASALLDSGDTERANSILLRAPRR